MTNIKEERTEIKKGARGGARAKAGRKPLRVRRTHRTYWASEEEHAFIREYLLQNRIHDPLEE